MYRKKLLIVGLIGIFLASSVLPGCIVEFKGGVTPFGWSYANPECDAVQMDALLFSPPPPENYKGYIYYDVEYHGTAYEEYKDRLGPFTPEPLIPFTPPEICYFKSYEGVAHDLKRGVRYYYLPVVEVKNTGEEIVSPWPGEFIVGTPLVCTLDADYGIDWATLNGKLQSMGGSSWCKVWFEYGASEDQLVYKTESILMNHTGIFNAKLLHIECGRTYYYRAVAENDVTVDYGTVKSFTAGAPAVETHYPENVGTNTAQFAGSLYALGGSATCTLWFEYGVLENSLSEKTPTQILTNPGKFFCNVTGLEGSTTYYVRAVADNGIVPPVKGNVVSFETH